MVDQEARRQYGQLIRQLASGRTTIKEYEDKCWDISACQSDAAIWEIKAEILLLCEGSITDPTTGRPRLNCEAKRSAARAVLYLQAGHEYQWPKEIWDGSVFLIMAFFNVLLFSLLPETSLLIRLGFASVFVAFWIKYEQWQSWRQQQKWNAAGDTDVWPFLRRADLATAVRHPRLLNGGR